MILIDLPAATGADRDVTNVGVVTVMMRFRLRHPAMDEFRPRVSSTSLSSDLSTDLVVALEKGGPCNTRGAHQRFPRVVAVFFFPVSRLPG